MPGGRPTTLHRREKTQITLMQASRMSNKGARISGRVGRNGVICVFYPDGSAEALSSIGQVVDSVGPTTLGERLYQNLEPLSMEISVLSAC